MRVGYEPDFTITSVNGPSVMQLWGDSGDSAVVTVCNQGTTNGDPYVEVLLSKDTFITREDYNVGSGSVGDLARGQCNTVSLPLSAGLDGTFYLGALIHPGPYEFFADNNVALGHRVVIGDEADLVVTSVQAPTSVTSGGMFTTIVTGCNEGFSVSMPTDLQVRLGGDAGQLATAPSSGSVTVGTLDPGACSTLAVDTNASGPVGSYYLGAVADPNSQVPELLEDNNLTVGPIVGITY